MKTLNFFNRDKAFETRTMTSFQNDVLTVNEMFSVRGGNGDEENKDDVDNGSTEDTQEDNFN